MSLNYFEFIGEYVGSLIKHELVDYNFGPFFERLMNSYLKEALQSNQEIIIICGFESLSALSIKICPQLLIKDSFCADLWDILNWSLKHQNKEVN